MQSPTWYIRRLRTMSPAELWWRLRLSARTAVEARIWPFMVRQTAADRVLEADSDCTTSCARAIGLAGYGPQPPGPSIGDVERRFVMDRAKAALEHRLSFFNLVEAPLGDPVRWNYEPQAGRSTPMHFWSRVDYRDYAQTGDCKFVWEPNRHAHLVALAQAYHLTGERRFAEAAVGQLESWIDQCPFGFGMNWRSPLELAIRLINWVWTLGLVAPSGLPDAAARRRIHECAFRHVWDIRRKYSRFSSANNHLIGEAAGVWIAATALRPFRGAEAMRREAREILLHEVHAQTFDDGGNREQALSYHYFVLEFFILSGLVARNVGEDFPSSFWDAVERMLAFAAALTEGGEPPMYGDADDGYVLGIGGPGDLPWTLAAAGAALLNRNNPGPDESRAGDRLYWLLGRAGEQKSSAITPARRPPVVLASRAFPSTGLFLLQGNVPGGGNVSVIVDGGELGLGPIAAHGHADALSLVLRLNGRMVLCDPGTYDYFTYPGWREYFRATRAHNTIEIDGQNQSQILGPFLWGRRARCRLVDWTPTPDGGRTCLEHDGYTHLPEPIVHRRTVELSLERRQILVLDELGGSGKHCARQYWHLAPGCEIRLEPDNIVWVQGEGVHVRISPDPALQLTFRKGETDPMSGWFSAGYHRKEPIVTMEGTSDFTGQLLLRTRLQF